MLNRRHSPCPSMVGVQGAPDQASPRFSGQPSGRLPQRFVATLDRSRYITCFLWWQALARSPRQPLAAPYVVTGAYFEPTKQLHRITTAAMQ
jgi:hypothetical protein